MRLLSKEETRILDSCIQRNQVYVTHISVIYKGRRDKLYTVMYTFGFGPWKPRGTQEGTNQKL